MESSEITSGNIGTFLSLFKARARSFPEFNSEVISQSNRLLKNGIIFNILRSLKRLVSKSPDSNSTETKDAWSTATKQSEILFYISFCTQFLDNEITELIALVKAMSDRLDETKLDPDACDSDVLLNTFLNVQMSMIRVLQQTEKLLSRDVDYYSLAHLHQVSDYNTCSKKEIGSKEWQGVAESWVCIGARGLTCIVLAIFRQLDADDDDRAAHDVKGLLIKASVYQGYSYIREFLLPVVHGLVMLDYVRSEMMLNTIANILSSLAKIFVTGQYRGNEMREDFAYELFYQRPESRHHLQHTQQGTYSSKVPDETDSFASFVHLLTDFVECYPSFAKQFWNAEAAIDNLLQVSDEVVGHHPFLIKTIDLCCHYESLHLVGLRLVAALAKGDTQLSALIMYKFFSEKVLWRWCVDHLERANDILFKADDSAGLGTTAVADATSNVLKAAMNKAMQMSSIFKNNMLEPDVLRQDDIVRLSHIVRLFADLARHPEVAAILADDLQLIDRLFLFVSSAISVDFKADCFDCIRAICRHECVYVEQCWHLCEEYSLFPVRTVVDGVAEKGLAWEFTEIEVRSERFPMTMSFLMLLSEMLKFGVPSDLGKGYRIPGIASYVEFVVEEVLLKAQSRVYDRSLEEVDGLGQRWKITCLALEVVQVILSSYPLENIVPHDLTTHGDILADFSDQDAMYLVNKREVLTPRQKSPGFILLSSILSNSPLTELLVNVLIYLDQSYIENQIIEFVSVIFAAAKSRLFNDFSTSPMYIPGSALVALDAGSSSKIRTVTNRTLQRTNSVFWIERTVAETLWILHDVAIKEDVFFKIYELNGRPITIQRRDQGRFLSTPVTPTSLTSILVGNDTVVSLIYLVTQRFAFLPASPVIELLALKLVQHVIIKTPEYQLCAPRVSDSRKRLHDISDIVQKFDSILLSDSDYDSVPLDSVGQYVLIVDRSAVKPLTWSLSVDVSSIGNGISHNTSLTLVRAEIINLFLKALQPLRGNLIHQLLGLQSINGNLSELFQPRRPCLFSVITLLNPRAHQLLLRSPLEAVDCYELIYRLCTSDICAQETTLQLRDHSVEFFRSQFEFFTQIVENRQHLMLDVTAFSNGFAWFLKTYSVELFRRAKSDEKEIVAQMLQLVFGGDGSLDVGRDSRSCSRMLAIIEMMVEVFATIRPAVQIAEQSQISLTYSRDSKGGIGFGTKNPFRHKLDDHSVEPPEFCAQSIQDAIRLLQQQQQKTGRVENIDSAVQLLTDSNLGRRTVASLQHLALSLKQFFELCFFTSCFAVIQQESMFGYDGVTDLVSDFAIPLLTIICRVVDYDQRTAESLVDVVVIIVQSLEQWSDWTSNGNSSRVTVLMELAKQLFVILQSGTSRGSTHHAKIALALMHLRYFLQKFQQPKVSLWTVKGDVNLVIERLLDVAVLSPVVRWQIVALDFLKSFYEDMGHELNSIEGSYVDFHGKDVFSRHLLSRQQLGNVLRTIFPLEESSLVARVELLCAFNDLFASMCEDLSFDLLSSEAITLLAVLTEKPDFEHLQLQLLSSTFALSSTSENELLVKERRRTLMRGFLSVVSLLTHVLHCSPPSSGHNRLLDIALQFYQRNVQTFASLLRMQSSGYVSMAAGLEVVTAFLATVTAKPLRIGEFATTAAGIAPSSKGVESWTDLWGSGSEIVLLDVFKLLQILGDTDLQGSASVTSSGMGSFGMREIGRYPTTVGSADILSLMRIFGKLAEGLVFREDAVAQDETGALQRITDDDESFGDSNNVSNVKRVVASSSLGLNQRAHRAMQVLRCAEHSTVFIRALVHSTATALKQQPVPKASAGFQSSSLTDLLLRVVSIPMLTVWIRHCLEALNFLSHNLGVQSEASRVYSLLYDCVSRMTENLLCIVYCLVDMQKLKRQERVMALDLHAMQAVEQLVRDASAMPVHSFASVVIRWLRELVE